MFDVTVRMTNSHRTDDPQADGHRAYGPVMVTQGFLQMTLKH